MQPQAPLLIISLACPLTFTGTRTAVPLSTASAQPRDPSVTTTILFPNAFCTASATASLPPSPLPLPLPSPLSSPARASSSWADSRVGLSTVHFSMHRRRVSMSPRAAAPVATEGGTSTSRREGMFARRARSRRASTPERGTWLISVVTLRGRRKEEGGRRKEEGGKRKEGRGRREEEGGRRNEGVERSG